MGREEKLMHEGLTPVARLVLAMYENEPCRICSKPILDASDAVWTGYSADGKSRASHGECFQNVIETVERQRRWIEDLQAGQYVNCVYCGHQYGPEDSTPVSRAELLNQHVVACPEHPMSKIKTALELVPPLLKQIRGFASDAFGGPSSMTDCIDLVLDEVESALEGQSCQ